MKKLGTLSLLLTASLLIPAAKGLAQDLQPRPFPSPPATFDRVLVPEPPSAWAASAAQPRSVGFAHDSEPQAVSAGFARPRLFPQPGVFPRPHIVVPEMAQFVPDGPPYVAPNPSSVASDNLWPTVLNSAEIATDSPRPTVLNSPRIATDSPRFSMPGSAFLAPALTHPTPATAIAPSSDTRLVSLSTPLIESPEPVSSSPLSPVSNVAYEPPPLAMPTVVSEEVVSEEVVFEEVGPVATPANCGCGHSHEPRRYADPSCRVPRGAAVVEEESWTAPPDGYLHDRHAHGQAACSSCLHAVDGRPCGRCETCRGPGSIETWWITRAKPRLQESHWGYPEEFEEKPFGSSLRAHVNRQIRNGTRDRMVLYLYDFHDAGLGDETTLNPHGLRRLDDLRRMMQCNSTPLVIEPSGKNAELDEARREHVLSLLQDSTFAVPEDWVVVARPDARGLHGEDALSVHQRMLSGGGAISSGGGSSSSSSSSGDSGASVGGGFSN